MEFFENGADMRLDGALRNAECPGNFLVAGPGSQRGSNLFLPISEIFRPVRPLRSGSPAGLRLNAAGGANQPLHQ